MTAAPPLVRARGRRGRRPRDAGPRAGGGARRGRRVRAAGGRRSRRLTKRVKDELRSQGRAQSRPHVGGGVAPCRPHFTLAQLADPDVAESEKILRTCVHCGFCTATCPTYVLLGDELDSPRGRIYLIKDMLENDRPATAEVVKHIDRCLSCLACMTTCPSGVHYMHLVDHARAHIEKTYRRPLARPADARPAGAGAAVSRRCSGWRCAARWLGKPLAPLLRRASASTRLAAMLRLAPARLPARATGAAQRIFPAPGPRRGPGGAARRLRRRRCWRRRSMRPRSACSTATASRSWCRGRRLLRRARPSHGPRAARRSTPARANIDAWTRETRRRGARRHPDHRVRLRHDGEGLRLHAAQRSGLCREGRRGCRALAKDISEYLAAARSVVRARPERPRRRLSRGLLAAARTEDSARSRKNCFPSSASWSRCAGRSSVLRLGGHLQHSAAGAREEVARAQGRRISKARGPT